MSDLVAEASTRLANEASLSVLVDAVDGAVLLGKRHPSAC